MRKVTYNPSIPAHLNSVQIPGKSLLAALDHEVATISHSLPPALTGEIRRIVRANLSDGRVHLFLEGPGPPGIEDYVRLVAKTYRQLSPYIHDLQVRRAKAVILPLYEQLQTWAYNLLLQKSHAPGMASLKGAEICGQSALLAILAAPFPYDTQFEPWAMMRLRQVCREAGAGNNYRLGPLPLADVSMR
jgi:hypothetical protein